MRDKFRRPQTCAHLITVLLPLKVPYCRCVSFTCVVLSGVDMLSILQIDSALLGSHLPWRQQFLSDRTQNLAGSGSWGPWPGQPTRPMCLCDSDHCPWCWRPERCCLSRSMPSGESTSQSLRQNCSTVFFWKSTGRPAMFNKPQTAADESSKIETSPANGSAANSWTDVCEGSPGQMASRLDGLSWSIILDGNNWYINLKVKFCIMFSCSWTWKQKVWVKLNSCFSCSLYMVQRTPLLCLNITGKTTLRSIKCRFSLWWSVIVTLAGISPALMLASSKLLK